MLSEDLNDQIEMSILVDTLDPLHSADAKLDRWAAEARVMEVIIARLTGRPVDAVVATAVASDFSDAFWASLVNPSKPLIVVNNDRNKPRLIVDNTIPKTPA